MVWSTNVTIYVKILRKFLSINYTHSYVTSSNITCAQLIILKINDFQACDWPKGGGGNGKYMGLPQLTQRALNKPLKKVSHSVQTL